MLTKFISKYEPMVIMKNIIIWFDGTVRPKCGHNDCTGRWIYDGQVFVHKDNSSPYIERKQNDIPSKKLVG